jgi:hypothetical protein
MHRVFHASPVFFNFISVVFFSTMRFSINLLCLAGVGQALASRARSKGNAGKSTSPAAKPASSPADGLTVLTLNAAPFETNPLEFILDDSLPFFKFIETNMYPLPLSAKMFPENFPSAFGHFVSTLQLANSEDYKELVVPTKAELTEMVNRLMPGIFGPATEVQAKDPAGFENSMFIEDGMQLLDNRRTVSQLYKSKNISGRINVSLPLLIGTLILVQRDQVIKISHLTTPTSVKLMVLSLGGESGLVISVTRNSRRRLSLNPLSLVV